MNAGLRNTLGIILLAGFCQASAQDSAIETVMEACKDDLQQYCGDVTPGEGRVLYCVAAHTDKLSVQCELALYKAASMLEKLAVGVARFARSCQGEIETLCGDVRAGQGRILACLEEKDAQVGDSCRESIARMLDL